MSPPKTWFVTGASQGLGLTLVKRLLREGYQVAATLRSQETLAPAVGIDSAAVSACTCCSATMPTSAPRTSWQHWAKTPGPGRL